MLDLGGLVGRPRAEVAAALAEHLPEAVGAFAHDRHDARESIAAAEGLWARGGRGPAVERLAAIDPER